MSARRRVVQKVPYAPAGVETRQAKGLRSGAKCVGLRPDRGPDSHRAVVDRLGEVVRSATGSTNSTRVRETMRRTRGAPSRHSPSSSRTQVHRRAPRHRAHYQPRQREERLRLRRRPFGRSRFGRRRSPGTRWNGHRHPHTESPRASRHRCPATAAATDLPTTATAAISVIDTHRTNKPPDPRQRPFGLCAMSAKRRRGPG
jgi:hypothetical protein